MAGFNLSKWRQSRSTFLRSAALFSTAALAVSAAAVGGFSFETYRNTAGVHRTFSTIGPIQPQRSTNAFFLANGTNGKTCEHCHFASDGWGILVDHANAIFNATDGLHPLFTPDAADNPVTASNPANVATVAQRRSVYSLMLAHAVAVVRINFTAAQRASAEFNVIGVDDKSMTLPTNTLSDGAIAGDPTAYFAFTNNQFWFHRRPIPTTNMQFQAEIGWDGRSTPQAVPTVADVRAGIKKVSHDTIGAREPGGGLTEAQLDPLSEAMTNFQLSTTTAQIIDNDANGVGAGTLTLQGATNGPTNLFNTPFTIGINDPFMPGFNSNIFSLYNNTWVNSASGAVKVGRAQILRGQTIFNTRQFQIVAVNGLNDKVAQSAVTGTCGTCHNNPNVGNHTSKFPVALGIAGIVFDPTTMTRTAPTGLNDGVVNDLPMFTLQNKSTNEIMRVTDLGFASVSGKWADIGKFKVALPRNLESRSPYFHNGTATNLAELVSFYNNRFSIGLSAGDQDDLVAFLKAL